MQIIIRTLPGLGSHSLDQVIGGLARIEVHNDGKLVLINYVKGPIKGYVMNYISGNSLISQWNISISPLFLIMKSWIKRHFMSGTSNALARIIGDET
ncbi:hypothetical protein [Vulcanisaeta souniana]|uniref:hypothetical protein n=1 Tax=Vulcanisaeta souniana TaxID=164452 RepID=UPI000ACDFA2B|nr:hypothetical protein [Vulcanisaeta souniana]